MSFIQVKNVPPDLHEAVRQRAAAESLTVSDFVLDLLRRELSLPSRREWIAHVRDREPLRIDAVEHLAAARDERAKEIDGTAS